MNHLLCFLTFFLHIPWSWLHREKTSNRTTLEDAPPSYCAEDEGYSQMGSFDDEEHVRVRKISFQTRDCSITLESGYPKDDLDTLAKKVLYLIELAKMRADRDGQDKDV